MKKSKGGIGERQGNCASFCVLGVILLHGASRCHASDRAEYDCPDLNCHAPFPRDKGDRRSRKCVSFSDRVASYPFKSPSKSIKLRIFLTHSDRDYNGIHPCGDTMINAVAIKSPNRRRNCPAILKFRSRKKFQVIGISIGDSGISVW